MRSISLILTALAISLTISSVKARDLMECTSDEFNISPGLHTGRFIEMRTRQGWEDNRIYFHFKDDSDGKTYCVYNSSKFNATVISGATTALLLDHKVLIETSTNSWLEGVSFNSVE